MIITPSIPDRHIHTFGDGLLLGKSWTMPYRTARLSPMPEGTNVILHQHHLPIGSTLICDECGAAFIIVKHPFPNILCRVARPETRRERRHRQGLRWTARLARSLSRQ